MRYLSVCSGIEAATVAWHPLGWEAVAFSQFDPDHNYKRGPDFPSAVLAHHWPDVPNLGDMTKFKEWPNHAVDLLVGGTPCQSFSVAGLRKGLDDPRGNLALVFLGIADRFKPRWVVWENVPGVLSSNGGRDFGSFLGALAELGYGFSYRVLDAQFFGVPQRRRRVFVVGYLGDWRPAAAVLFERESLRRDPPPRRETGAGVAALTASGVGTCSADDNQGKAGHLIAAYGGNNTQGPIDVAAALNACGTASSRQDFESETFVAHTLRGEGFDASEDGTGRGTPLVPVHAFQCHGSNIGPMGTLRAGNGNETCGAPCVAFHSRQDPITSTETMMPLEAKGGQAIAFSCKDNGADAIEDQAPTLRAMSHDGSHANAGGQLAVALSTETMYGDSHADAKETNARTLLRTLRNAVGEEAFQEWGIGVSDALHSTQVLWSEMHGKSLRSKARDWKIVGDDTPSCAEDGSPWTVFRLWDAFCDGCPPSRWKPSEQLAGELIARLSELPYQSASWTSFVRGLWQAAEGIGLLRKALSTVQAVGRPASHQEEPAQPTYQVRRLTPTECEALQGFPRNYTLIPWRGKPPEQCPDGPRYKALGNSMAVPVMRWIGERINLVNDCLPRNGQA